MNHFLRASLQLVLGRALRKSEERPADWDAKKSVNVSIDAETSQPLRPSTAQLIKNRAGVPLAKATVVPVPPGDPNEPEAKKFNIVGDRCYVRAADWPQLKKALQRVRRDQGVKAGE